MADLSGWRVYGNDPSARYQLMRRRQRARYFDRKTGEWFGHRA